jgi:anthranilate synthase component 2
MKILVFDNYDSFTYNLVHLVKKLGYMNVEVHRNDQISLDEVERFDKIILSPGPGLPNESGILLELIKNMHQQKAFWEFVSVNKP